MSINTRILTYHTFVALGVALVFIGAFHFFESSGSISFTGASTLLEGLLCILFSTIISKNVVAERKEFEKKFGFNPLKETGSGEREKQKELVKKAIKDLETYYPFSTYKEEVKRAARIFGFWERKSELKWVLICTLIVIIILAAFLAPVFFPELYPSAKNGFYWFS